MGYWCCRKGANLVRIRFGRGDVVFEIVFMREVCAALGKRVVVWVRVFRFQVEMEVAVDAKV